MLTNKDKEAWRKLSVKRDNKFGPLVEKLVLKKENGNPVFRRIKDLMVFAAMVGYSKKIRGKVSSSNTSIILETYATDDLDGFIYLLSLMTTKDVTTLKDDNLPQAISIFEEYCHGGLDEIKLWLDENPTDLDGIDTLNDKIFEQIILNKKHLSSVDEGNDIEVEF